MKDYPITAWAWISTRRTISINKDFCLHKSCFRQKYNSFWHYPQKQSCRSSFPKPTACIYAYMVVEPKNLKPLFFRSLEIWSDKGVFAGTSDNVFHWFLMGKLSV